MGTNETVDQVRETVTDLPGRGLGDNLPFQMDRDTLKGGRINNVIKDGGNYFRPYFDDYYCDTVSFAGRPQFPLITSYPGEQSTTAYATSAVKRTSPNQPNVDLVTDVLELGDIPRTVQNYGNTMIERHAGDNLWLQFGIFPLVRDARRIVSFSDDVHKRLDVIKRLKESKGYRKTVQLDNLSTSQTNSNVVLQSNGIFYSETFDTIGRREIRGHVRWLPIGDFNRFTQPELLAMAKRAVTGMEVSFASLWEAMPWSWLIDWYTNVGDLLSQTRNIIPCTCDSVSIIRQTFSESTFKGFNNGEHRLEGGTVTKIRKERYPGPSLAFDAHLPLLGAGQMGILASLLVMKRNYAQNPVNGTLRPF